MNNKANVKVDASKSIGTLSHNWNYIGMDECNYIFEPEGIAILEEFGRFSEKTYYVRPHFLFCNGNLHGFYKWGSTNIYREDKDGNPIYDYTTIDEIFDTILQTGNKPFVELGFMPLDLVDESHISESDLKKENNWGRYWNYKSTYHSCPPKDYLKWQNLVTEMICHMLGRYGEGEVATWYFELWNEPDIMYWKGTHEEYIKLYDYTAAGVKAAFPKAQVGGPAVTGPKPGEENEKLLDEFLDHCRNGQNYVTGEKGAVLDFITFHVKGGGFPFEMDADKKSPCVTTMLEQLQLGLDIIKKYGYGDLEVVLSEADPDGWAAGGIYDNVNMRFRNTSYYPSFVAASFHHMEKVARTMDADVRPLTWGFVFRGERAFEGTRAFQTQGIDKPVFHYFRMVAQMGDNEVELISDKAQNRMAMDDPWAGSLESEVNGFATADYDGVQILLYCHHDDQWGERDGYDVKLSLSGMIKESATVDIYQVDKYNCNSHTLWEEMGSPKYPEGDVKQKLIKAGTFSAKAEGMPLEVSDGCAELEISMPAHALALVKINY
jgi:xylan 1,4-beta-xylosidase